MSDFTVPERPFINISAKNQLGDVNDMLTELNNDKTYVSNVTGTSSIEDIKEGYAKYRASLNAKRNGNGNGNINGNGHIRKSDTSNEIDLEQGHIGVPEVKQSRKEEDTKSEKSDDSAKSVTYKLDMIELNNSWNDSNEDLIVSVGENAASYKWMHEKSATLYSTRHQVVSFIMVLLTIALSAESIIPTEDTDTLDIVRRILTYMVTIVTIFQSFLKYETKAETHKNIALKYSVLYNDIRQVMTMYRKTRPKANDYIQKYIKQYDNIIMESPEIPQSIISTYKKIVGSDISQPTIADRIQNIQIISEKPISNLFKQQTQTPVLSTSITKATDSEMRQVNQGNTFGMMRNFNKGRIIEDDITDAEILKVKSAKLRYELERLNQHN